MQKKLGKAKPEQLAQTNQRDIPCYLTHSAIKAEREEVVLFRESSREQQIACKYKRKGEGPKARQMERT